MRHSRVAPPQWLQRFEESAQVLLLAMVLAKIALSLEGRPSVALSALVLVLCVGGLLYYRRLRPRWATKWPIKLAGTPSGRSVHGFSKDRSRLVACMFLAAVTGGGGLTALGLDDIAVGVALGVLSAGLLAVAWRLPWPFE
jgi:hypothetical protein